MSNRVNRSRILLNKGKIYWNGDIVCDSVKAKITIKPTVTTSKSVNEVVPSSRWAGIDSITVEVTEFRATSRAKDMVKNYMETGETPEVTIQGTQDDKNSDYYDAVGKEIVTALGCVPTNDITLLEIDGSSGDHLQDSFTFNAKDIKF